MVLLGSLVHPNTQVARSGNVGSHDVCKHEHARSTVAANGSDGVSPNLSSTLLLKYSLPLPPRLARSPFHSRPPGVFSNTQPYLPVSTLPLYLPAPYRSRLWQTDQKSTMACQLPGDEAGDPALLDKIEKLLAAGLGHHIDLPQLVIVGDQSSGKSSVLEALTKFPFSRGSGLCTRFPTQVVFRTSKHRNGRTVTPSIIPASDTEPGHARKLKLWKPSDMETLDALSFSMLMDEVCFQ